jgi:predicted permease
METLLQDVRYGWRMLFKSPGFTAVIVLTLGIGIGANTALFSVVDAVLLRALPYPQPEKLVAVHDDLPGANLKDAGMSQPELEDFEKRSGVFDEISPVWAIDVNVTGREKPERLEGLIVSPNYFSMLGSKAAMGRVFVPSDYRPGFFEGAVISDSLWRRMFGADAKVLGQDIRLDTDLYTVIGVLPPEFEHPGRTLQQKVDVWITAGYVAAPFPQPPLRALRIFPGVIGRIKDGLTVTQANLKLQTFAANLREQYPNEYPAAARWTPRLVPLREELVGKTEVMLILLLSAVGAVLMIACVNIASLLLARSSSRHREVAIRQALGAGVGRMIRQTLTESVVLSLCGGALALLLSFALKDVLLRFVPANLPRLGEVSVDSRALLFVLAISLLTGILFGIVPALQMSDPRLMENLRQGTRGGGMASRQYRFLSGLVVFEFALSLVLIVGAGLLLRSFWNVLKVDPGLNPDHLMVARIWLPVPNNPQADPYGTSAQRDVFIKEVLRRVSALPGVEQAGISSGSVAFSGRRGRLSFTIEGRSFSAGETPSAELAGVSADLFRTLGTPLIQGRFVTDADDEKGAPVALIDQTAAELFWPNQNPINQRITFNRAPNIGQPTPVTLVVAGVVGRTRSDGLDVPYAPHIFVSLLQFPGKNVDVYIRTAAAAESMEAPVRREVQAVDPSIPVFGVRALDSIVADSLASRRFTMQVLGVFAATALLLAALGIYGVMAYFVSQRVREIGIRMALGAERAEVLKMVVAQGMKLAAAGVGLGIVASLILTRLFSSLLFGVSATDPWTLAVLTCLLTLVALLANYIPASRAAKIDPMVALRYE